jgi:hypothetical protein
LDLFWKQVFSYTTYIQEEVNYTEPSPQLVIPGYTHKISSTSSLQNLCNFAQGDTGAEKVIRVLYLGGFKDMNTDGKGHRQI